MNRLITGAHLVCYINNKPYGNVAGVSYSINTSNKYLGGIDTILPTELIPQSVRYSGTLNLYRVIGEGSPEAQGLVTSAVDMTKAKYASIIILDRSRDAIVAKFLQARFSEERWSAQPKSLMTGSLSFEALVFSTT